MNENIDLNEIDTDEIIPDLGFPKISVSAINCNSLNMSTTGKDIHLRKIYGIVKLRTDIILLSDIRLCNKAGISDISSLKTSLSINPYCSYKILYNSKKTAGE